YEWSEPTLSLGYFQSIAEVEGNARWRGVPVVRRPSGGGAILHDREVTFTLAMPIDHPLSRRSSALYRAVHDAVSRTLSDLGVLAIRRGTTRDQSDDRIRPFLCFQDRDPEDLVVGPWKLVGSAQRRRAGAVLQHGSLPLGRSKWTPELPGLHDLTDVDATAVDWPETLRRGVPPQLGLRVRSGDWPPTLLARAAELSAEVYSQARWTRRR
ncbi:MAG: biotin/lipoate A/B protein ligase family protein, partial [Isosphaeraceae bacterium]